MIQGTGQPWSFRNHHHLALIETKLSGLANFEYSYNEFRLGRRNYSAGHPNFTTQDFHAKNVKKSREKIDRW